MRKVFFIVVAAAIGLASCHAKENPVENDGKQATQVAEGNDPQAIVALYHDIDSLTMAGKMDREKMKQFVKEAVTYAHAVPTDTLSPHFLLYAGITQMQLAFSDPDASRRYTQAIHAVSILDDLRRNYTGYRRMDMAYYYRAQIYENLGKTEEARQAYLDLVHRFPDTDLGKSVAAYLQADGYEKSADEIMQGFKKGN